MLKFGHFRSQRFGERTTKYVVNDLNAETKEFTPIPREFTRSRRAENAATKGFIPLHLADRQAEKALMGILEELSETARQDGVNELIDQQKAVLDKGHELFRKELWILNMNEKYDRLNKIKMFIEIGFPISLGIVGIGSTIFALFN